MSKKKKRTKNNGRHYEIREWVEFILDGVAESEEFEGDVEITPALEKEVERYKKAVDDAVEKCSKQFPPAEDIIVGDDEYYDLYQTITGAGVGIWDGRWDRYYPDYKQQDWDRLGACYEAALGRFADGSGGGTLEAAFSEAVYDAKEANPSAKAKETRQLKNKLLR